MECKEANLNEIMIKHKYLRGKVTVVPRISGHRLKKVIPVSKDVSSEMHLKLDIVTGQE